MRASEVQPSEPGMRASKVQPNERAMPVKASERASARNRREPVAAPRLSSRAPRLQRCLGAATVTTSRSSSSRDRRHRRRAHSFVLRSPLPCSRARQADSGGQGRSIEKRALESASIAPRIDVDFGSIQGGDRADSGRRSGRFRAEIASSLGLALSALSALSPLRTRLSPSSSRPLS